jgi:hypothetical protein
MSKEMYSQWPCPYCFGSFPTPDELRSHLEADKVVQRLQRILGELQKVLLHQTCSTPNREGIDKYLDQSPESPTGVHIAKPLDLTCPHVECKNPNKVYTQRKNLLRHYQSREYFHSKL